MDNIKKFEDFLDRMQGLLDSAKKQGHILVRVEDLENTFPELRESEDERIKKWLISQLKIKSDGTNSELDIMIDKAISWLEKQGKPTDINPSEFDLRLNKLLKQFETLSKEELASSLSFYLNVVQNDGTYKPTDWSDEDEKILNHIISIIEIADDYLIRPENIPIYTNWLKKLVNQLKQL